MSAHLYFHLPSGRASWSIRNKGVITKRNLMNHFLNNPLYHSCEQIHISTWSLCPIRHIGSVLLVNFASVYFASIYIHIISTLKISLGSQWFYNYLTKIILVRTSNLSRIYQVLLVMWIRFRPKDFQLCYTIKIQVLSCIKDKSFLFIFLLFLLINLSISSAVQEPKFFLGTPFQLQKLWCGQSCRIGSKFYFNIEE